MFKRGNHQPSQIPILASVLKHPARTHNEMNALLKSLPGDHSAHLL